jgi:CRP-like cAMP-binding protein
MKIISQFSKRLRYLDAALSRLTLKNKAEAEANPNHLFRVAEYYMRQNQYNLAYYAYHQYIKYCPSGPNKTAAREKMMKIAPYVKGVSFEQNSTEMTKSYAKDTMLFSEWESGDELYIIQRGSVKIVKIMDDQEVLLAVLKAGDIFGEMALLEAKPRAACAVAYEDCTVLAVNRDNFQRLITTQPQIIARLTTLLSERIWFIYKQLANTLITDPLGRMYDALLIQLEKKRVPQDTVAPHIFDFGPRELADMVGIAPQDANFVVKTLMKNDMFRLEGKRLMVRDVTEVLRQTNFYRKMQHIEKSRQKYW